MNLVINAVEYPIMDANTDLQFDDQQDMATKRRKARRAPREKRHFKPYSALTWQERKELEMREAESPPKTAHASALQQQPRADDRQAQGKRRRRRHRGLSREQPPPAPRNTTQAIIAERQSPKDPDENFMDPGDPNDSYGSSGGDSAGENFFEQAFDEVIYDDLNDLDREALIQRIRDRDREVDRLRSELAALKESRITA